MKRAAKWGMVLLLVGCLAGMAQAAVIQLNYPSPETGYETFIPTATWTGPVTLEAINRVPNSAVAQAPNFDIFDTVWIEIVEVLTAQDIGQAIPGFVGRLVRGYATYGAVAYPALPNVAGYQSTCDFGGAVFLTGQFPGAAEALGTLSAQAFGISGTINPAPRSRRPVLQGFMTRAGRFGGAIRLNWAGF